MNIKHEQAKEERRKVSKYVHDNPGASASEIGAALGITSQIVASRLRQLRGQGEVHVLGQGYGRTGTWHPGQREEISVVSMPEICKAMGYREITPQRGRHVAEAHSHSAWRGVAPGIQSGFSCVWPDHG